MAIGLSMAQIVLMKNSLMSQVVRQEALTRLLIEKAIFAREEFLERVIVGGQEIKIKKKATL